MGNCNCYQPRPVQANIFENFSNELADIDVNQLSEFIHFIDDRLSKIKGVQQALSTSNSTNAESVNVGIKFGSSVIEKISKKVEEFPKTGVPQEMGRMTVEVVKQIGQSHWVLLGLLMVASALERMDKASSNEADCIELLETMTDLAKIVQRLNNTIPEEADILNKAVQVIVGGATICCNYISKGKTSRYWTATLVGEQLEKTRTSIERTSHSIDQVVGVTTLEIVKELKKQITRREKESQQKLLEFEPVGIHRQVEEVKELLEMEGSSPSVAVILYGFGGIGKSTLAKSVIEKLNLTNYIFCRVIVDAEIPAKTSHIAELQKNIIFALCEENIHVGHPDEGREKLGEALENKSSFIFIDNTVEEDYVMQLLPKKMSGKKAKDENTYNIAD